MDVNLSCAQMKVFFVSGGQDIPKQQFPQFMKHYHLSLNFGVKGKKISHVIIMQWSMFLEQ